MEHEHDSNLPSLPAGVQNTQTTRHDQEDMPRFGEPTLTITQPLGTGTGTTPYTVPDTEARPQSSSTGKFLTESEGHSPASALHHSNNVFSDDNNVNRHASRVTSLPPPVMSRDGHNGNGIRGPSRRATMGAAPGLDWIVPVEESLKTHTRRTLDERIVPTLEVAIAERDKYAKKAMWTGYALNAAIGLQVLLGALTTAISAATSGRQTSIATSILGGLSTLVASYLARARGSNEPELSITRVKDLEQFIRDCRAFQMDHGHMYGDEKNGLDRRLEDLRRRFEELLGNANGERRLAPPV